MIKNKRKIIAKKIPLPLIVTECQWWTKSVLSQIKRIEENMNSESYEDQVQRLADDYFLRISLKKVLDWTNELDCYIEETGCILMKMNEKFNITLLRNISEHEIEYYKGIGNKQKKFINKEYNQTLLRCTIINGIYYISGKININDLKQIIKELDSLLIKEKFTYKYEAIKDIDELYNKTII